MIVSKTERYEKEEEKREEETQTAGEKLLAGLNKISQSLGIAGAVGAAAAVQTGQKAVAEQFGKVSAALGPEENASLTRSADGLAWQALKGAVASGVTPTAKQTQAARKLWLNEPLAESDREEFLNAPWMIGAVDGLLGGKDKQAQYFRKSAAQKKQKGLAESLKATETRAQNTALSAEARRLAVWKAEDIRKQLTAVENELYEMNGRKRYAKVDMRESMAALADTATVSGKQGALAAAGNKLQTKVMWKGHKSKDIDEGLALVFNGTPEKMTAEQARAVKDFMEENSELFDPEILNYFQDQVLPALIRTGNYSDWEEDGLLIPFDAMLPEMQKDPLWNQQGNISAAEAAALAKVMDERVPLEDKGKYLRALAEMRSKGENLYESKGWESFFESVDQEMARYDERSKEEKALESLETIYGLFDAMTQKYAGKELTPAQQAYLDDFYYTQLTHEDLQDASYLAVMEEMRKAELRYWDVDDGVEQPGSYLAWEHAEQVRAIVENYIRMDMMAAKSCGLSYSQLLKICPQMAWDMDALYAKAVAEYDEAWGAGGTPAQWIAGGLELIAPGAGATLDNEGVGLGNSLWLGVETGAGELIQGPLDFNAMLLCPPVSPRETKRRLEEKYLVPYGAVKGREMIRQRMEEVIELVEDEGLKRYLRKELENCGDILLGDFNEDHILALERAYQNQDWVRGKLEKAKEHCTPAEYILAFDQARSLVREAPENIAAMMAGGISKAYKLSIGGGAALQFMSRFLVNTLTVIPTQMRESYQLGDLDLTTEEFSAIVQGTLDAAMDTASTLVGEHVIGDKAEVFGKVAKRHVLSLAENSPLTRDFMTEMIAASARVGDAILDEWYVTGNREALFESIGGQLEEMLLLNSGKDAFEPGEKEAMLTMLLSPQSRQLETYLLLRGGGEWPLEGISMEELQAGVAQYVMQDDYYASEEALAIAREVDELEEKAKGVMKDENEDVNGELEAKTN